MLSLAGVSVALIRAFHARSKRPDWRSTGCQWRALPKDLPPRSTVHDYLGLWNWDGTLDRIHHALYLKGCESRMAVMSAAWFVEFRQRLPWLLHVD